MNIRKRNTIIACISILSLVLILTGTSLALYDYSSKGITENSIKVGTLSVAINESVNPETGMGINLTEAYPISDEMGKNLVGNNQVFDFTISGENDGSQDISFEVTLEKLSNSNLSEDAVKIYLTDVTETDEIELLEPSLYSELTSSIFKTDNEEKVLFQDEVKSNEEYNKRFRLRMWVSDSIDYESGDYDNKEFETLVNVHSDDKNGITKTKEEGSIIAPTAKILMYTGNEQELINAGSSATGTVMYKLNDGEYSENIPTASEIGTYTVYYKVIGNRKFYDVEEESINVTIEKYYVCKRATTLHTEICSQPDTSVGCASDGYAQGSEITYGNLGIKGTLTSGDAFDCDVNGDDIFDVNTERFYYVTDLDNETAVLIYYNSVASGEPNNTSTFAYNTNYSKYLGPQESTLAQLPTTSQWNKVSLKNSIRNIIDETGKIKVNNFSYEGYAARLLTSQELQKACGITIGSNNVGELKNCKYLMENTRYSNSNLSTGPWLENQHSTNAHWAWYIHGGRLYVYYYYPELDNNFSIRPVIEVPKQDIKY